MLMVTLFSCSDPAEEIREKNKNLRTAAELSTLLPKEILEFKPRQAAEIINIKDTIPGFERTFSVAGLTYYKGKDSIRAVIHDFKKADTYYHIYTNLWTPRMGDTINIGAAYVSYGENVGGYVIYDTLHECTTSSIGAYDRFYLSFTYYGKNDLPFVMEAGNTFDYTQLKWY